MRDCYFYYMKCSTRIIQFAYKLVGFNNIIIIVNFIIVLQDSSISVVSSASMVLPPSELSGTKAYHQINFVKLFWFEGARDWKPLLKSSVFEDDVQRTLTKWLSLGQLIICLSLFLGRYSIVQPVKFTFIWYERNHPNAE